MKKLLLIFSITTLLTGCLGIGGGGTTTGGSSSATDPNFTRYEHTAFSIDTPKDWEVINSQNFTSNVPQEAVVGFRNNLRNEIFTANVNVSQTITPTEITSEDLGKSTLTKAKESLVGFKEIGKNPVTLAYGTEGISTFISTFEGKKTPADPIIRFKQLYAANKGAGYVITAAYLPTEDESVVKMTDEMLNSFSLK
ncbi:MAG: hypothetical protein WC285_02445 [Candidatus Gracilibacteria bacterium]|jgi:hypothetical protein